MAKLAEHGVKAYAYFTVEGWGPRTNALLPASYGGANAWQGEEVRIAPQSIDCLLYTSDAADDS